VSNPQWLRVAEQETRVRFTRKLLLAEGTYAVIRAGRPPRVVLARGFVPVARQQDLRAQGGVWRGFTAADRTAAQQTGMRRHVLAPARGTRDGRVA